MRTQSLCMLVVALLLAGKSARADVYTELTGTRSFAMGGSHRALGTNNETLWLNPAGMAATRRYNIDLQYGYGTGDRLNHLNASAVDSKSGPVAGGVGFTRSWGNESGVNPALNRFYLGAAYAFNSSFAIGSSASYTKGNYTLDGQRLDVNAFNTTVGAMLTLAEMISFGVSYQNIVPNAEPKLFRPQLGVAAAIHASVFALSTDMLIDMRQDAQDRLDWLAGVEAFFWDILAVRAGYHRSATDSLLNTAKEHFVSAGVGIMSNGGAFNAAAERAVTGPEAYWRFLASFQFFM